MKDLDPSFPDLIRHDPRERDATMHVALWLSAGFWMILAALFWLVPVVSGIPFLALGIVTLAMASERVANWINSWERSLPHGWRSALRMRGKLLHRARVRPPLP